MPRARRAHLRMRLPNWLQALRTQRRLPLPAIGRGQGMHQSMQCTTFTTRQPQRRHAFNMEHTWAMTGKCCALILSAAGDTYKNIIVDNSGSICLGQARIRLPHCCNKMRLGSTTPVQLPRSSRDQISPSLQTAVQHTSH